MKWIVAIAGVSGAIVYADMVTRGRFAIFIVAPMVTLYTMCVCYFFARSVRAQTRTNRWMNGQCVSCGYDLRASKDRCPECGAAINLPPSHRRQQADR
jgi:predicted RNA-binding Zn-ribbon protein involved in translation (DUF1610 family)